MMEPKMSDDGQLWELVRERYKKEPNLCEALRNSLGGQVEAVEKILNTARNACEGKLILCGTMNKPFFVGKPPRWYEDRVGDGEYVVELNRMQHWNDCIAAYALTGEHVFPELIMAELDDWIRNCPCPAIEGDWEKVIPCFRGPVPWSSLEAGLRLMNSWYHAFCFLVQEDLMDKKLFTSFAASVKEHANMLMQIPPRLWPDADHNHYLSENVGLFHAAVMLQEYPEAEKWCMHAERELERCVKNQLTEDGGQIEGCPLYHNVCMDMFSKWAIAAKKCGIKIPEDCMKRIRNALDYSIHSLRPTGQGVPWGDSDPDDQVVQTAILGYRVFGSREWIDAVNRVMSVDNMKKSCARYCFSTVGVNLEEILMSKPQGELLPHCSWQHELQQTMLRTGWDADALSVFFACRVPCQNGHGHIDPAGFDFCAYGKALLVDPGRYSYREEELRRQLKSAKMHNTLTIGGREPFEYVDTFSFAAERDGCILGCEEKERFMVTHAMHTSYFPAIHERLVGIIDKSFLIVWDRILHMTTGEPVEIWYNMNTENAFIREDGGVITEDSENLFMRFSDNLTPGLEPGLISEAVDVVRPSTRLCLRDSNKSGKTRNYLSVIFPFRNDCPEISQIKFDARQEEAVFEINHKSYRCVWYEDEFVLLDLPIKAEQWALQA